MKAKKKSFSSEIFTGSMADISFLLIIYFMVTMAFSANRGMDFALPEEQTKATEIKQEDAVDILVQPGGGIQVDGRAMALEQMHSYLLDKLRQNPEKPVILRTDPGATYGNMIAVFDDLRMLEEDQNKGKSETDAKFKINISIPTRREIENIWSMLGVS